LRRGHCSAKPGVFHSVPEGTLVLQDCTYICDSLRKANEKSGLESLGEVNAGHNRACKVELGERDSRTRRFLREVSAVGTRGRPLGTSEFVAALEASRGFISIDMIGVRNNPQANMAAIGTGLCCRPMTTIPDSVTCHPRARSASRSKPTSVFGGMRTFLSRIARRSLA